MSAQSGASRAQNFIVLGAGAIGCYVGGRLALSGQQVTFVGRPRVLEALAQNGLTVTDLDGFKGHIAATQLHLAASLKHIVPDDKPSIVLLCVKGGATLAAAQTVAQVCKPGTSIVSLQNGVDNVARIQANAPQMKALAGMVPYNVVMPAAHHAHRASMGFLQIENSPASAEFAPLFNAAGLATELVDNIRAVQWGKLLLNLNNPVNALSNLPLHAQLHDREYRFVLAGLQTEALGVMAAAHIQPAKVAAVSPRVMPHLLRLPNWLFTRLAARMLRMDATARSSMWDDLNQGRTTEIDDLCGAVVRLAQAHGASAPFNQRMAQLMTERTQSGAAPGLMPSQSGMSGDAMRQAIFE